MCGAHHWRDGRRDSSSLGRRRANAQIHTFHSLSGLYFDEATSDVQNEADASSTRVRAYRMSGRTQFLQFDIQVTQCAPDEEKSQAS